MHHDIPKHKNPYNLFLFILTIVIIQSCAFEKSIAGFQIGNNSPEIILPGIDATTQKLSDHKGKLVLLEFWCATSDECRKNHFEMNRLFNQFKNETFKNGKGFTIFSVSLDTDKQLWKSAIAEDQITWSANVCDTLSWNSSAAISYQIQSLPKYYLLDANGIIIQKNFQIFDLENILESYEK